MVEKIDDDKYDLESYEKAMKEYKENPKTYTLEQIKKELDI